MNAADNVIKHVGRYRVAGILESDVSSESHPPFCKRKASIPPLRPRQMKSVGRALHSVSNLHLAMSRPDSRIPSCLRILDLQREGKISSHLQTATNEVS